MVLTAARWNEEEVIKEGYEGIWSRAYLGFNAREVSGEGLHSRILGQ